MTDYTELQRLAEHHLSLGHAYTVATPAEVLALIAENERLFKLLERTVDQHVPLTELEGVPGWSRAVELVEVVAERDQLKAENEALRKDSERLQSATAFVQKLCDAAVKQPSVATGYLHDILSAMGKEEQS